MKNRDKLKEQEVCNKLYSEALSSFKSGDNATGVCRMQEALAIEIVRDTGDFTILLDTVKEYEAELIRMANYFFDHDLEIWGGTLAGMVGLLNSISLNGEMAEKVKTQKNRESAQGPRGLTKILLPIWKDAIEEELCKFNSEGVPWTKKLLRDEVELKLSEQGIASPNGNWFDELTSKACDRLHLAKPKPGRPPQNRKETDIGKIKAVILQDYTLAAKGISERLNKELSEQEVDSLLSSLQLRNKGARQKFASKALD